MTGANALPVRRSVAPARPPTSESQASLDRPSRPPLLLIDFDKTLTDCDAGALSVGPVMRVTLGHCAYAHLIKALLTLGGLLKACPPAGERLVGALAPELAPMLAALEMPANFVPTTNAVLGEMQRRGVSKDAMLAELRRMGSEIPQASVELLQRAMAAGHDVRILSDCNSVFIGQVLAGAGLSACVTEVITNPAAFHRVAGVQVRHLHSEAQCYRLSTVSSDVVGCVSLQCYCASLPNSLADAVT